MNDNEREEIQELLKTIANGTAINANIEFKKDNKNIVDDMNQQGLSMIGNELNSKLEFKEQI